MRRPSRAKATSAAKTNISGKWRITEMDVCGSRPRACGIPKSTTGARRASRSRSGPSRSPPAPASGVRDGAGVARCGSRRSVRGSHSQSNDLKDAVDHTKAYKILMELCQADLRCLDAHAHLGNFVFDRSPKEAIRHYEVGLRIGELSLGESFEGVLLWGHIDNRPFLRCMHGYGLCLWRLGGYDEAGRVFEQMLWLNATDNQGARVLVEEVRAGTAWEENRDDREG
jgi:hypothetical protein